MKIGWDGVTWILRDLWQKNNDLPTKVSKHEPIPNRLVAKVSEALDNNTVLLRWEGRDIRCRVDTPVQKGEHLLLQFKEESGEKQLFKVLARSFEPIILEGDRFTIISQLLLSGFKGMPLPLLLRIQKYISEQEDKDERYSSGKTGEDTAKVTFEFIIETETLGVVIIKIEKHKHNYTGKLLVEAKKTGELLEKGLPELQKYTDAVLLGKDTTLQLLRWEVVPVWDLQKIRGDLRQISFVLDRKV